MTPGLVVGIARNNVIAVLLSSGTPRRVDCASMANPSTWLHWFWPEPAFEPSLESWRAALTAYTLRVLAVTAGLMLVLVLASYGEQHPPAAIWTAILCYPVALVALVLFRRSRRVQTGILLGAFQVITPPLFAAFGPAASPYLCLLMACVLAAVLIGRRTSFAFMGVSIALIVLGASLHLTREHAAPADVPLTAWFRISLVWLAITGWVVFVTNWLTNRIELAFQQKRVALAAAKWSGEQQFESEQRRAATESALIEAQRHEAVSRIAAGVSHDFNNTLFVILGWNDLLSRGDVREDQRAQGHEAIAKAGRQATGLTRRLVAMGRERFGVPRLTELQPLVEDGIRYVARLLPDSIRVSSELSAVPLVFVDPGLLQQVLLNLALQARDSMPDGGRVVFELRARERGDGRPAAWVSLTVRDSGPGFGEQARDQLLQPWGAARDDAAGIGLAATRAIVERAGGRLEIESTLGVGTVYRVLLPVAAPIPEPAPEVVLSARRGAILVVEDDDAVRELMVIALRRRGHVVREAADGDRAMVMLDDPQTSEDLLCIDGVIPGAPSIAIIQRFRIVRPGQPVLVCSGHIGSPQLRALVQDERLPSLPKPFTPDELTAKIDELLEARSLTLGRP